MNKTALKIINNISKELPVQMFTAAIERRRLSGADAILANQKEIGGKPVDPEGNYIMKMPVRRNIDHKLRMKRIYKKRGKVGLITYLKPYVQPAKFGEVQVFIMKNIP